MHDKSGSDDNTSDTSDEEPCIQQKKKPTKCAKNRDIEEIEEEIEAVEEPDNEEVGNEKVRAYAYRN